MYFARGSGVKSDAQYQNTRLNQRDVFPILGAKMDTEKRQSYQWVAAVVSAMKKVVL